MLDYNIYYSYQVNVGPGTDKSSVLFEVLHDEGWRKLYGGEGY